ncbi:MAG: hypothetical protein H6814_04110 [Phycisphaeraceae bacterium]|nr:hypothetical protein [Phycisphaeraceae bacterium]
MTSYCKYLTTAAGLCVGAASAQAGLVSPEMFQTGDPAALWGAPIASLDVNSETVYNWASGFEVPFPNGLGQDITELTSRVYNVSSPMMLSQGGDDLMLNPGDKVYAYTLTLVESSATTVDTVEEFQVGLLSFIGGPIMDASLIKGRGFYNSGVNGPVGGDGTDLEDLGIFGSSLDWRWDSLEINQLQNEQTITLLMFTENSLPFEGIGDLRAPTGQISGSGNISNLIPVLVPTTVPTPGASAIWILAGALCSRRKRPTA